MRYNFIVRIYKDKINSPILSSIQEIVVSDIPLISKTSKFGGLCFYNKVKKRFGYSISFSKKFNEVSGSHSLPTLTFKGDYIDITVNDFPRFPVFTQEISAVRSCLNGWGYTNYLNNGFPKQLLYRKIEFLNIKPQTNE
jgi:hypothetical protein